MAAKTVPLKADWDRQPRLGDGRGHHAARAGVDAALADFIERRAEGALLVVGHRGSGKTSSVIAAANRAAGREERGRAVVPIMIKATSMDKTGAEGHKTLLQSLIWALHRRAARPDRKPRALGPLQRLVRKLRRGAGNGEATDTELQHLAENLYLAATASIKSDEVSRRETRSRVLGTYPIAAAASAMAFAVPALHGVISVGLVTAPVVLAPFLVKLAWNKKVNTSATHSYKRIYGFADMQHDFEDLLRRYSDRHKIVFILDEFDKHDDFAAMIQPLKMLFNQGDAVYVVITSPEKAHELMKKRGVNHTLFSEVLYINRPRFKEMEGFIDDVVDAGGREAVSAVEYDDFRCCMRYKSQTDFFALYGALRDRRAGADEEGRPLVAVSLDEQEATEANLQRSIEFVYDRKARRAQSMQMANDGMLDAMYEATAKAEGMHGGTITVNDELTFADEAPTHHSPPLAASAVRDLIFLLYRQGYLTKTPEGPYRIGGRLAEFDPAGIFVEEENAFVAAYDAALGALADFANAHSRLVDGRGEPFRRGSLDSRLDEMIRIVGSIVPIYVPDEARDYRAQLRKPDRPILDPDKLRAHTDGAKDVLSKLRAHAVVLLSRVLEHSGFPTNLYDQIPPNLTALDFAAGQPIRNATHHMRDVNMEFTVAVLQAPDASFISKIRSSVASPSRRLEKVYVVLVGDVEPVGLSDATIPIGPDRGAGRKGAGAGALDMAKRHSTYILAVASPPDAKAAAAASSVVKLVAARLAPGKKESFEKFWGRLLQAAGAADSGPSSRDPDTRPAGSGATRRRAATARVSRPARGSQGGASQ